MWARTQMGRAEGGVGSVSPEVQRSVGTGFVQAGELSDEGVIAGVGLDAVTDEGLGVDGRFGPATGRIDT